MLSNRHLIDWTCANALWECRVGILKFHCQFVAKLWTSITTLNHATHLRGEKYVFLLISSYYLILFLFFFCILSTNTHSLSFTSGFELLFTSYIYSYIDTVEWKNNAFCDKFITRFSSLHAFSKPNYYPNIVAVCWCGENLWRDICPGSVLLLPNFLGNSLCFWFLIVWLTPTLIYNTKNANNPVCNSLSHFII